MFSSLKILAVVPARGGSKGIPRKNIRLLGGEPLIGHTLKTAMSVDMIDDLIVSTDDNEISDVAKKYGAEVLNRPSELATVKSSTFSVIKHTVSWLSETEQWNPEIVVILQPTTPFRKAHHIDGVLDLLINSKADAVITIRKPDYPPQWMLKLGNEKKLKNLIKGGNQYKRRQDTPLAYQPAGTAYAFRTHLLYEIDTLFPFKDTRGYVVKNEEAINIDTYNDYEMAKIIYEKNVKW